MNILQKYISHFENSKAPFVYFIITFYALVLLRTLFEAFSTHEKISPLYISYAFFYTGLALSISLLLYIITQYNLISIIKVVLPSFAITIIVPLLDIIIGKGAEMNMTYYIPDTHGPLIHYYFTFFGAYGGDAFTPGMRIEIAFVLLGIAYYVFQKTSSLLKALFASFFTYSIIFMYGAAPYFLFFLSLFGIEKTTSFVGVMMYLLSLIQILIVFYMVKPRYFKEILYDIRLLRLIHYILMFIFGMFVASGFELFTINSYDFMAFISLLFSITFAWIFSVMSNNITDLSIDKVSNNKRPLCTNSIPQDVYVKIMWVIGILSLVSAGVYNFNTLFLVFLFMGVYFLYSMEPLRLKRILFFSKFLIALNSLLIAFMGYHFYTDESVIYFPTTIVFLILISFTFVINFIDLKDYKGDKKAGIKTLPVLLGMKNAQYLIALFFIATYSIFPFVLEKLSLLYFSLPFGFLIGYFITKKPYNETPVFLLYLSSMVFLICFLVLF